MTLNLVIASDYTGIAMASLWKVVMWTSGTLATLALSLLAVRSRAAGVRVARFALVVSAIPFFLWMPFLDRTPMNEAMALPEEHHRVEMMVSPEKSPSKTALGKPRPGMTALLAYSTSDSGSASEDLPLRSAQSKASTNALGIPEAVPSIVHVRVKRSDGVTNQPGSFVAIRSDLLDRSHEESIKASPPGCIRIQRQDATSTKLATRLDL